MVCAFLEYLADYIPAPATIRNKLSHIRTYLRLAGADTAPMYHIRVTRALEAINRNKAYQPVKKIALPMDALRSVIFNISRDRIGVAIRTAILLIYYGALRQSEVAPPTVPQFDPTRHPTRADVVISTREITMTVKWAKNMQKTGETRSVTMTRVPNPLLCPVQSLSTHFAHTPTASSSDPILVYPDTLHPIPLTVIRQVWEQTIHSLGLPKAKFSLHSIRKSAATQAHLGGCGELTVQRLGGWKSAAYKQYIDSNNDTRANRALIKSIL